MSSGLYRHAILLVCAKFHLNWTVGCTELWPKSDFVLKWRPFAILNLGVH